jgi:hypothetical protein
MICGLSQYDTAINGVGGFIPKEIKTERKFPILRKQKRTEVETITKK